jgi:hypothetical protein
LRNSWISADIAIPDRTITVRDEINAHRPMMTSVAVLLTSEALSAVKPLWCDAGHSCK